MKKFKQNWNIVENWQLIFPLLGSLGLIYSSNKLASIFFTDTNIVYQIILTVVLFFMLLKFILYLFKALERKWALPYRWEYIAVFMVFAITGTSSVFISRPIIKLIGITKENLNPIAYWVLYIIIGFIFYQILLVFIGWLLGQFKFFWNFEKKMLRRIGFKRMLD